MRVRAAHLVKPVRGRHRLAARAIHAVVSVLGASWRLRVQDESGITDAGDPLPSVIWIFWHNRVLAAPIVWKKCCPHRGGAVLTSPSDDGAILAEAMRLFGATAVRGSSSKRGGAALLELEAVLRSGQDVVITPDGPRGPRYAMSAGPAKLALRVGVAVQPVHIEPSACWRLRTWDGFAIPKPFSRVHVRFGPLVRPDEGGEVEALRLRLANALTSGMILQ